jgi:hypothetical protein
MIFIDIRPEVLLKIRARLVDSADTGEAEVSQAEEGINVA